MSSRVVEVLNQARARELTAISQYMVQHYELEDQGFKKLASKLKEIGIQEMKHAESLAEHILFLNGEPATKPDGVAIKGQEIAGTITTDIGLEDDAVNLYNDAVAVCAAERDEVSKRLFDHLLEEEEEHLDFFRNTLEHIEKLGAAYLATLTD